MKVFLHLGAHKTGTTFVQTNLASGQDFFERNGWRFIFLNRENPEVYRHLMRNHKRNKDGEWRVLAKFLKEVREGDKNVMISSENLLGRMSLRMTGGIYTHHEQMIERLKSGLDGAEVGVAFSIRNYADYIESTYQWQIVAGRYDKFEAYLEQVMTDEMSWPAVAESLVSAFGAENVFLSTYEMFRRALTEYIAAMLDRAGLPGTEFQCQHTGALNTSFSKGALGYAAHWNEVVSRRDDLTKDQRKWLRFHIRNILGDIFPLTDATKPRLLPDALRAQLSGVYEAHVADMKQKWPAAWRVA